jgi:hypothetical protein
LRPVICRTLRREFRLHPPDEAVAGVLAFVAAEPELPGLALAPVDIPIGLRDGFLVASMPDGALIEGSATYLLGMMHRVILNDLVEGDAGTPLLHGATIRVDGKRFLLVGHKGCGKSTLALHLAMRGIAIEGDEHLLVRETEVIARPRTLRVKEGSLRLVAGLPADILNTARMVNWDGSIIRAVSPAVGGAPWVIRPGPLDGIVLLTANHGGRSVARKVPAGAIFERLMREVLLPPAGVAAAAGRIRRLVLAVPGYELWLGDLTTAEWQLRNIAKMLT